MLRSGNSIRLAKSEKQRISILTGAEPDVKTAEGLNNFLETSKLQYSDGADESTLMMRLLDSQKV